MLQAETQGYVDDDDNNDNNEDGCILGCSAM
jgi:hypothetical protein